MLKADKRLQYLLFIDQILKRGNPSNIMITKETSYSSTFRGAVPLLVDIIKQNIRKDLGNIVLTDGTSHIGGDAINLSHYVKHVQAIEKDPDNYKALVNNINVFDIRNITPIEGNALTKIPELQQDLVYIDAPWGGSSYKEKKSLKLMLGNMEILTFFLNNQKEAKLWVFKIPTNYDKEYMQQKLKGINYKIYEYNRKDKHLFDFLAIKSSLK